MVYQHTVNDTVRAVGIGLHSGQRVSIAIRPAPVNSGIAFKRMDLPGKPIIVAAVSNVVDTTFCTAIGDSAHKVMTIEHLMSAFSGLGVDNAMVEVNSEELPIMDGSSAPFVHLIRSVGLRAQANLRHFIRITSPIHVEIEDKRASLLPWDGFKVACSLSYRHPFFNTVPTAAEIDFAITSYVEQVCWARTYGFLADYERLRAANLAKGGSLDNAVVIGDDDVINQGGLRSKDECVKHKILDVIGDLCLLGYPLLGEVRVHKPGHGLNNKLANAVMKHKAAWEWVTVPTPSVSFPRQQREHPLMDCAMAESDLKGR